MRIIIEKIPQNKNKKTKTKRISICMACIIRSETKLLYIFYLYKLQKRRIVKERAKQREKNNNKIEQKLNIAANQFIHTHAYIYIESIYIL